MSFRLVVMPGLLLVVAACGGSSSETPPPVEPSSADLSTYRAPPAPAASGALPIDDEDEPAKDPDPVEEPGPSQRKKKRPVGPPPE